MKGFIEPVNEDDGRDIYAYVCNALPEPLQGPGPKQEFVLYVIGAVVWLSGADARYICSGKRNDSACPVKGIVVDELHRNQRWFSLVEHLPQLWEHYHPGEPAYNFMALDTQIREACNAYKDAAAMQEHMRQLADTIGKQRRDLFMAPFKAADELMARLAALETTIEEGDISFPDAKTAYHELCAKIETETLAYQRSKVPPAPELPAPLDDTLTKEFLQSLLDQVKSKLDIERVVSEATPRILALVRRDVEFRVGQEEEASRKRIREAEEESIHRINQEEECYNKRIRDRIAKVDRLENRMTTL